MKILGTGLLISAVALVGCSRESPKGGPGANPTATTTTTTDGNKTTTSTTASNEPADRTQTFSVKVPSGETHVKQGDREEVTITLDRGSNFKESVTVKFQAPAGLKVVPDSVTLKGDDAKTKIVVEAMENAPEGRHSIKVVGVPNQGKSTSVTMDVEVKKKS